MIFYVIAKLLRNHVYINPVKWNLNSCLVILQLYRFGNVPAAFPVVFTGRPGSSANQNRAVSQTVYKYLNRFFLQHQGMFFKQPL